MKVTIITPCYNAAPYIQRTIASVQAQTMADWEMLIVDDGSTDNSVSIIQSIAEQDSRIRLIEKENGGSASARNMGLRYAKGEYIQFLDADDTLAPDKFEKQIKRMENNHLDVSYTDYRMFNPDGSVEELRGLNESLFHLLVGWGVLGTIPPHCYLYKQDFLQAHNLTFDPVREREDWGWHIKVFSFHPNVQRLKGYCGAYYFRCPTGKTTVGNPVKLQKGNCRFLCYRISTVHGIQRFLLLVSLSVTLWTTILQHLRYKNGGVPEVYHAVFAKNKTNQLYLVLSILLMPLSIFIYLMGFSRAHYLSYKKNHTNL